MINGSQLKSNCGSIYNRLKDISRHSEYNQPEGNECKYLLLSKVARVSKKYSYFV